MRIPRLLLASALLSIGLQVEIARAQAPTLPNAVTSSNLGPFASGTASISPDPSVSVSVATAPSNQNGYNGSEGLTYYFSVVGPSAAAVPVQINFDASTSITATTSSTGAEAYLSVFSVNGPLANYSSFTLDGNTFSNLSGFNNGVSVVYQTCFIASQCYQGSSAVIDPSGNYIGTHSGGINGGSSSLVVSMQPNQVDAVTLFAYSVAYAGNTANASIDPTISLAAGFAGANQYTIALSSGVGNPVVGVPEPSSYAMLIVGLGIIGLMVRRRHSLVCANA